MGGGPSPNGGGPAGPTCIIGNDKNNFTENFSFRIFIDLTFLLAAKTFLNANSVLTFMYLLAPMSSIFTDVILRIKKYLRIIP
jgi:hypothetical protein